MNRSKAMRWLIAATVTITLLAATGCGSARRTADPAKDSPRVRVSNARILDADPGRPVEQGPVAPAAVEPPDGGEPETDESETPADVAPDVMVSLDVVDVPAAETLRGLAYQGNVDLSFAQGIDSRVTVHLKETPWAEAFQAVLTAGNLVARWDGLRVRILTAAQLAKEHEALDAIERQRPETAVLVLQNLPAEDAAKTVQGVLGADGKIGTDLETNALVVTAGASRLKAVRRAVGLLDRAPPQVMIEATIVDVVLSDDLRYGLNLTATLNGANTAAWSQRLSTGAGANAALTPGGAITFTVTPGNWTLDGLWDFIETHNNTKVLANPRILAVNNREANIEIIEEIPYQQLTQTSAGGQIGTTEFKQVGVKLNVKPRIAADGTIHLILVAEQSNSTTATVNQIPVIQTRKASNVMVVGDGQTIVIGGLRRRRTVTTEDKIPLVGDIPVIGALFRRSVSTEADTELAIFITPHIVRQGQGLTDREKVLASALDHRDRRTLLERSDPLRLRVPAEEEKAHSLP